MTEQPLAERVLAGDAHAVARAVTLVERDDPRAADLIRQIFPGTGRAFLVGMTGSPGAGKSTLTERLIARFRADGHRVGVLAVDPTSPFTGGAILGDRVRMQGHAGDRGVFIRSMATRGHLGGLARATGDAALVLDAAGFTTVIVETVGVGQDEVEIVRLADVTVVMLVPGAGDEVQALKAGIMEIADIFVVNKADREGTDRTVAAIEAMLSLAPAGADPASRPPIVRTVATAGRGIEELAGAIERFRIAGPSRAERRRTRIAHGTRELLCRRFLQYVEARVLDPGDFDRLVARIEARDIDPYTAADGIIRRAVR